MEYLNRPTLTQKVLLLNIASMLKVNSHRSKAKQYKERTKLQHAEISEMFLFFSTAAQSNQSDLYINEKLTLYKRSVMKETNQRKRNKSQSQISSGHQTERSM